MKNHSNALLKLWERYSSFRVNELAGRYITSSHIAPILKKIDLNFTVKEIGKSTLGIPIHTITAGHGSIKILAWSQMHGNESTTTKAIFDLLYGMQLFQDDPLMKQINEKITLLIIPMLNPDGALRYTRENENKTDLNRDALRLKEVESKLLRKTFLDFDPDYCLNLHDQRSIFSAGPAPFPATLSFLTPAMDEERRVYPERIVSMKIIAAIAADLKPWLPEQIGRYSDEFNPNCTGDTFQSLGKPTLLFEAGHFSNDYQRDTTRKYVMIALFSSLINIFTGDWEHYHEEDYLKIPANNKLFYDIILRQALINGKIQDVAIQYKEILENNEILFQPTIEKIGGTLEFYGHKEIKCGKKLLTLQGGEPLRENVIVNNMYLNDEVLAINYQII